MKKIIALVFVLSSILSFAGNETEVIWFRADTEAKANAKMMAMAEKIQERPASIDIRNTRCDRPKLLSAQPAKLSYRANRYGELEAVYSAVIKVICRFRSND